LYLSGDKGEEGKGRGREGERIDCEGGKSYNVAGARDRERGRVGLREKRQKNGESRGKF